MAGYRLDEQQDVPKIEKPRIDQIKIDPTRQSAFFKQVTAMKVKPLEPPPVLGRCKDYKKEKAQDGVELYYVKNPLNDLFSLTISEHLGTRHDNRLSAAVEFLDKSGTKRFSGEELKKNGTSSALTSPSAPAKTKRPSASPVSTKTSRNRWALLMEVLQEPTSDSETLDELKKIILVRREDAKKDFGTIGNVVRQYNRYGTDSAFLKVLPNEEYHETFHERTARRDQEPAALQARRHVHGFAAAEAKSAALCGSIPWPGPCGNRRRIISSRPTHRPPIAFTFSTKEQAQAMVRIEFADGKFAEANNPPVQLFNDYFGGGMAGVVFQELREARALAYSVGAVYATGSRKGDENIMSGAIGCQADKTPEALDAFLELFEKMPAIARPLCRHARFGDQPLSHRQARLS